MNAPTKSTLHKTFNISPFLQSTPRDLHGLATMCSSIFAQSGLGHLSMGCFPIPEGWHAHFLRSKYQILYVELCMFLILHAAQKNIAFALPVPSSNQNWWRLRRWHQSGTEGRLDRRSCSGWNISQSQKNGVLRILHMFVGCFTSENNGHKLGAYAIEILSV